MYSTKFKPLCLSKRDNISRFIYIHQDRFIYIKFHISVLRLIYIHQDVNLSKTRFKYTYQHLHTRIKIRIREHHMKVIFIKFRLRTSRFARTRSHTRTSRFSHIYIKIHIYIRRAYLTCFTLLSSCRLFFWDTGERSVYLFSIYYSLSFSIMHLSM